MDSTIRPLYLCLSIIWSYVVCEATYIHTQVVDCDPSSGLPCSTDVKFHDFSYGVTEDIEILLRFRFTGQMCQNPKISMEFVQQDFGGSNEYLRVYEGAATTDLELAQCGTVDGWRIGDCGYHNCLDAKALGESNMLGKVNLLIYVPAHVDGLHHSPAAGEVCPGGYNLDAKLTLTCDAAWCEKATVAPLGMNDYVLLVLGMVNVVLLTILLVHCSYTRASKTVPYGKVLAYDTESA